MRLSDERIKQGILHPEREIRGLAVDYFAGTFSSDTTVMSVVIRAVETYGRADTVQLLRQAERLAQSPETIAWAAEQLRGELDTTDVHDDNYRFAVAMLLCGADPALLIASGVDFAALPHFPEKLVSLLEASLDMHGWDWGRGFEELKKFGRRFADGEEEMTQADADWGSALVRSLARHRDERAAEVLRLLAGHHGTLGRSVLQFLEPALVELAGEMRLEEAIPTLIKGMASEDLFLSESCMIALVHIGGDAVVRAVAAAWPTADYGCCVSAASVLENIHTDLCTSTCLDLLGGEEDPEVRLSLGHALLAQFTDEAIEPVRVLVEGPAEDLDVETEDLRQRLVAVATVMDTTFPEYQAWYDEAVRANWGWEDFEPDRMLDHFDPDRPVGDDADSGDEFDDEDFDNVDYDAGDHEELLGSPEDQIVKDQTPGRNDPCPCGSGKKYKMCCMRKQSGELFPE